MPIYTDKGKLYLKPDPTVRLINTTYPIPIPPTQSKIPNATLILLVLQ